MRAAHERERRASASRAVAPASAAVPRLTTPSSGPSARIRARGSAGGRPPIRRGERSVESAIGPRSIRDASAFVAAHAGSAAETGDDAPDAGGTMSVFGGETDGLGRFRTHVALEQTSRSNTCK